MASIVDAGVRRVRRRARVAYRDVCRAGRGDPGDGGSRVGPAPRPRSSAREGRTAGPRAGRTPAARRAGDDPRRCRRPDRGAIGTHPFRGRHRRRAGAGESSPEDVPPVGAPGLLDPASGATDWLPPPGVDNRELQVVDLTSERLVLVTRSGGAYGYVILVFDRAARTWQRSEVQLPSGVEVHFGPQLALNPDDRLYLGSMFEGQPDPVGWWSAPLTDDSPDLRAEPELARGRPSPGATTSWSPHTPRAGSWSPGRTSSGS